MLGPLINYSTIICMQFLMKAGIVDIVVLCFPLVVINGISAQLLHTDSYISDSKYYHQHVFFYSIPTSQLSIYFYFPLQDKHTKLYNIDRS